MSKRLTLSSTDKKLAGVCGGISEYLGMDPTIVRVLWVVFTLMGGSGIIAYLIAMILMPNE